MKQKYEPRWRYHKSKKPVICRSLDHEKFLGEEWKDSPAKHGNIAYPPSSEDLARMEMGLDENYQAYLDGGGDEREEVEAESQADVPRRGRPKKQE